MVHSMIPRQLLWRYWVMGVSILIVAVVASLVGPKAHAQTLIAGDAQRVFHRGILLIDNRRVQLWGVVAPGLNEPHSGSTALLLRRATMGQRVECLPLGPIEEAAAEASQIVARCFADGLDLSAALVASGLGRPCRVANQTPYAGLAPPMTGAGIASEDCP